MIDREKIIKSIPKPSNSDVIVYDITLKDLIEIDVINEYYKILPNFLSKKENYDLYNMNLNNNIKAIDNIYLYNRKWTEENYLKKLSGIKQIYAKSYSDIKKIEDKISILKNKIEGMNNKIELQKAKENQEIENRKKNIDENINKNKELLLEYNEKNSYCIDLIKKLNKEIEENEEEFKILEDMQHQIKNKTIICKYCGSKITINTENVSESKIYKRLMKNLIENQEEISELLNRKKDAELDNAYYNKQIAKIKEELNNDISLKKDDKNLYIKKSIEILKLEGLRDELMNNMSELQKELKNNSSTNSDQYISFKKQIEQYELSLNNLSKIKLLKEKNKEIFEKIDKEKKELDLLQMKIEEYIKFIKIYYKIYEQKLNIFFGENYNFKLFAFDNFTLKEILKITYKGINYIDLDIKEKEKVDSEIYLKLSIYE